MCCTQCQGWRTKTSTSSTDYCVTFLCVQHRIVLAFVRVSAFCTEILYRSSRFVKPEEDIWISGFTSCVQTQIFKFQFITCLLNFLFQKNSQEMGNHVLFVMLYSNWAGEFWFPSPAAPMWSHDILMGMVYTAEDGPSSENLLAPQNQHPIRLTIHLIYITVSLPDGKLHRHFSHQWTWDHIYWVPVLTCQTLAPSGTSKLAAPVC